MENIVNRKEHLLELLKDIHKCYPVGFPLLRDRYDGYLTIVHLVETKINALINNNDYLKNWNELVKDISDLLSNKTSYDQSYLQEPSLKISFKMLTSSENMIDRETYINLYISLFTNYFTVFFNELFYTKSYIFDNEGQNNFTNTRLASIDRPPLTNDEKELLQKIKDLVQKYYLNYSFVDYQLITQHLLHGAIPFGMDTEHVLEPYTFPLKDFIFGSESL